MLFNSLGKFGVTLLCVLFLLCTILIFPFVAIFFALVDVAKFVRKYWRKEISVDFFVMWQNIKEKFDKSVNEDLRRDADDSNNKYVHDYDFSNVFNEFGKTDDVDEDSKKG